MAVKIYIVKIYDPLRQCSSSKALLVRSDPTTWQRTGRRVCEGSAKGVKTFFWLFFYGRKSAERGGPRCGVVNCNFCWRLWRLPQSHLRAVADEPGTESSAINKYSVSWYRNLGVAAAAARAGTMEGLLLNAIQVNDHSVGFFEVINVSE